MGGSHESQSTKQIVVLIASDELGQGSPELGKILIRSFVKTLSNAEQKPRRMIFVNSGVRLTTEGSDLIDDLKLLEETGVELLSCGTCLDYFHLKEKLQAGRASNMVEIVETLTAADSVVRP
jgi:selenium metabolism protein YedF